MASLNLIIFFIPLLATLFFTTHTEVSTNANLMYPFICSPNITTCSSYLYHISRGLTTEEIASFYSVSVSQVQPKVRNKKQDYLVSVPCGCSDVNGTTAYFYNTTHVVQPGDTFSNVTTMIYSGQAWNGGGEPVLIAGEKIPINLLCACSMQESQAVVTYTVQENDTLLGIANLLSSDMVEIKNMNSRLIQNPRLLDVGWVLYVPVMPPSI